MDFGKAFSFVFDDSDWLKKVAIGGIVCFVPVLNFAALGYSLEVTQRVINDDPTPLPEWDDIGGKWVKGLLMMVIGFVYMLPIILLSCVVSLPLGLLGGGDYTGEEMGGIVAAISSCFSCLALIYSLFAGVVMPAAVGNYAAKDQFGAAFHFGDVFGLVQKNLGPYLMVLIIIIVVSFLAALVGGIACFIGVVFTGFYALLVMGHATGQAYREASANIGLI